VRRAELHARRLELQRAEQRLLQMVEAGQVAAVRAEVAALDAKQEEPPLVEPFTCEKLRPDLTTLDNGRKLKKRHTVGMAPVTGTRALPSGEMWKIGIGAVSGWIGLGVMGTTDVTNVNTCTLPSAHFWACSNEVRIAGANLNGHGGWQGFQTGDVCIFKLEATCLRMRIVRLGAKVFEIPLPVGTWYAHANLHCANAEVELLPVSPEDEKSMLNTTRIVLSRPGVEGRCAMDEPRGYIMNLDLPVRLKSVAFRLSSCAPVNAVVVRNGVVVANGSSLSPSNSPPRAGWFESNFRPPVLLNNLDGILFSAACPQLQFVFVNGDTHPRRVDAGVSVTSIAGYAFNSNLYSIGMEIEIESS
jgi:hypothetical protein